MKELLIYIPKETNRVRYVLRLVFFDLLKVSYSLTTDLDSFQSADQPKMMYGNKAHTDDLFFKSSGLLFERGVKTVDTNVMVFNGDPALFPVYDEDSVLPFDVFSAIFYLVSRYEEYLPFVRDQHGRFAAHLSISTKLNILQRPMVNLWALEVKKVILERYPEFQFPDKKFRFIATYDVDSAWAFSQKGFFRTLGGFYLALKNWRLRDMLFRAKVLFNKEKDPFDTFDLQMEYQRKYNLRPLYFILFGQYTRFDKNISIHNRRFRRLVKWIADYATVGVHPSYYSTDFPELLKKEKTALEDLLKTDIKHSRQHFLKLTLPDTYQNFIENDILEDYTMGYAALPGFRAGICDTYRFYDLDLEVETKLRIHPFTVMDGTLKDYMHLGPTEAIERIRQLMNEVKQVNGTFISLWHNESLSNKKRWRGWRRVYENMLEMASNPNPS
ncbi:MAG: polysaccharide deacetylase family protein [Bacteroidales bacterium]|nr:polysaccharide deacetylase family protein [Bacteroidales bacterium]